MLQDIETKIRKQYNPDFSIYSEEVEESYTAVSENSALAARKQLETRQACPPLPLHTY